MADPYCIAMVLADAVHRDTTTGKHTILGTFSTVGALEFPASIKFSLYYAITDAEGDFSLSIRIVDSSHSFDDNSEPAFELKASMHSPSPLAVVEGSVNGMQANLERPGVYHCELLVDDTLVMSRRLVAFNPQELKRDDEHDKESDDEG